MLSASYSRVRLGSDILVHHDRDAGAGHDRTCALVDPPPRPGAAFQAQFAFLIRRFEQLKALDFGPHSQRTVIADFIFEKDKLFACLNLSDQELDTYNRYYNNFRDQLPTPDLVIYLQATPEVLKKRLKKKNAPGEKAVNEDYLEEVIKAYEHFFFTIRRRIC